jgi:chromosome segregation ATPase
MINEHTPMASGENGLIKTPKQLLIDAEKKIGQLENEARMGAQVIEKLKWQNAQLRIGVTSLAMHAGLTPEQVKEIYDAYCAKQDAELQKSSEEAKKKFMEDLKAGKVPDLTQPPQDGNVVEFKKPE